MKGFWVPISKALASALPHGRAFSRIEAAFSLQLDYDRSESVTVAGMAARWGWSRKKVSGFLSELGIEIEYPEATDRKQNQRGQIRIQIRSRSEIEEGQIKFIDNKDITDYRDRTDDEQGQKRSRSNDTTKETRRTRTKNTPCNPPLFLNDDMQEPPPAFSPEFQVGPWAEWCRTKKGGPYRNKEAAQKQLDYLYELSAGDERKAAEALKEAFRAGWQSFKWVFKNDQTRNDHDNKTFPSAPSGCPSHGARNLDSLENLYYGDLHPATREHVADSAADSPPHY